MTQLQREPDAVQLQQPRIEHAGIWLQTPSPDVVLVMQIGTVILLSVWFGFMLGFLVWRKDGD